MAAVGTTFRGVEHLFGRMRIVTPSRLIPMRTRSSASYGNAEGTHQDIDHDGCQPPTLHRNMLQAIRHRLHMSLRSFSLKFLKIMQSHLQGREEGPESLKDTRQLDKVVYVKIPKHIQREKGMRAWTANLEDHTGHHNLQPVARRPRILTGL